MTRRVAVDAHQTRRGPVRHNEVAKRAPAANREAADEASIGNSLLATLPHALYRRLLATGLEPVALKFGKVLHEPGAPIRYAYFPIDCHIALLTTVNGHQTVEVALVGHEGMVGSPLALGIRASSRRALVQGAGIAMRMESACFRIEVLRDKPLRQAVYRYKHALIGQIAQSAACKQFHSLQARLARYLLMTGDCARSSEILLTHEFLARMLSVRRVGVTKAAGALQKRKMIKYARGKITILDRKRLSAASCECYQIIKRLYDDSAYADG
jgi:CRP-like cAMP-binding protein